MHPSSGSTDVPGARTVTGWRGAHLLVLPSGTDPADVVNLARRRHPGLGRGADGAVRLNGPTGPELLGPVPLTWWRHRLLTLPGTPGPGRGGLLLGLTADAAPHDVELLSGLARRLGGMVRANGSSALLQPGPSAAVDLQVRTTTWVEPAALLLALDDTLPVAESARSGDLEEMLDDDPTFAASAGAGVPEPYVVSGRRQETDLVLLVHPDDGSGPGTATARGQVDYEVCWDSAGPADAQSPSERDAARAAVAAVTLALQARTGGTVVDSEDFVVDLTALEALARRTT